MRSLEISPARSVHSSAGHSLVNTPSSSIPSTPILPARPPSPERRSLQPEGSSAFLTAVAAQERRVLELKEELERAESDLERLKRQWASYETSKKMNEIRHVEQLRPISKSVSSANSFNPDGLPGASKELAGRKVPSIHSKQSQMTVFPGSRHTRALSLLSPKLSVNQLTISPSTTVLDEPRKVENGAAKYNAVVANALTPIVRPVSNKAGLKESEKAPSKDIFLETGKQFVGDLREGLRTFFGDIKQSTVGNERVSSDSSNSSPGRNRNAAMKRRNSKKKDGIKKASNQEVANIASVRSDTKERKLECLKSSTEIRSLDAECKIEQFPHSLAKFGTEPRKTLNPSGSDDDGWDNWDSLKSKDPLPRRNVSSKPSNQTESIPPEASSPRTSIR